MKKSSMRTKVTAGVLAAGVLAGGGTAVALLTGGANASATVPAATATATAPSFVPFPLQQLVDNATITQAQASALHAALFQYVQTNRPAFGSTSTPPVLAPNGPLQTVLGQLVKNGTITQAQASAITNAMSSWANTHFATMPGTTGTNAPHMMMGGSGIAPRMGN